MTTARRFQSGLLQRAVESILNQSYHDWELVICDDASRDGTEEYLAGVAAHDSRVHVFRNPINVNSVSISLGRCLLASDAGRPLVSWMFDDCELRRDALQRLVEAACEQTDIGFVYGSVLVHRGSADYEVGADSPEYVRAHIDRSSILIPHAALAIRRSVFDEVGWFDSNIILRRSCDWDFFNRAIRSGTRFSVLNEILCDEWGELQRDSLRNAFTTDFPLMRKYSRLREHAGWDLSLDSCLHHPMDRLPEGDWSVEEIQLCYYMMLEYFISVGNSERAAVWARRLAPLLSNVPFFADDLGADPTAELAFSAIVWGAFQAARAAPGQPVGVRAPGVAGAIPFHNRIGKRLRRYPALHRTASRTWDIYEATVTRLRRSGRS